MKTDTKNYYLALLMSVVVVFGWNYFYAKPQLDKDRQNQAQLATAPGKPAAPGAPGAVPPQTVNAPPQGGIAPETPAAHRTRADALAAGGGRVAIDTPSVEGSIALTGARLDDLSLKSYRETPSKNSPHIVLLSPHGAPDAYYVEQGFVPPPGGGTAVPTPSTVWTKTDGDRLTPSTPVTLSWDNGHGLVFTRMIAVDADYMFTVRQTVANTGTTPVTLTPYALAVREGTPPTSGYSVLHEGYVGYVGTSEQEITYAKIEKEAGGTSKASGTGGWAGFTDKYWATALIPDQQQPFEADYSVFGSGEKTYQTATIMQPLVVPAQGDATASARVFAGAKVSSLLNAYEAQGIKKFDLMIDWGYLWFITKPMFALLDNIYKVLGNFGLAIIGLTFLVKLVFFPLANRSYMSMAKMKAAQPQLAALKERYPDDKMRQQQEMMKIYKAEKINPVAGCLPMVIQIPVFFALYKVLFVTIEMRQAPFTLWVRDLSQPDPTNVFNLFGLLPFNPTTLPVVGHFLAIGILPIIMGISMFLQMKMNPEPTDPVQKTMFSWMPVIFTFMLGTFPSGLVVYWTTNNTLTLIQQSLIMKRAGVRLELFDNLRGMFRRKTATSPAAVAKSKSDVHKLDVAAKGGKEEIAPGE